MLCICTAVVFVLVTVAESSRQLKSELAVQTENADCELFVGGLFCSIKLESVLSGLGRSLHSKHVWHVLWRSAMHL